MNLSFKEITLEISQKILEGGDYRRYHESKMYRQMGFRIRRLKRRLKNVEEKFFDFWVTLFELFFLAFPGERTNKILS